MGHTLGHTRFTVLQSPAFSNNHGELLSCLAVVCSPSVRDTATGTAHSKSAMTSGKFDLLNDAPADLVVVTSKLLPDRDTENDGEDIEGQRIVDEETVLCEFGPALRQVKTARDTFITSCDICDQLLKDILLV